jgi:hypothetical protein
VSELAFVYSLQPLHTLKAWQRQTSLEQWARSQHAVSLQEQEIKQLKVEIEIFNRKLIDVYQKSLEITVYQQGLAWMRYLQQSLAQLEHQLVELIAQRASAELAYQRCDIAFEAVDTHRKQAHDAYHSELITRYANEADEDWRIRSSQ